MFDYVQSVLHPERYHGNGKTPPFFEGWYYKLVDAREQQRFAVISGVFFGPDENSHTAFVQVLDGSRGTATYHTYPVNKFWAARDKFDVRIGPNRFAADYISLDIESEERAISGTVRFTELTPWPVSLSSPGSMGWYGWLPFIESYHSVVSLDHVLRGTLLIDGEYVDFADGRGYSEKDWGKSFPANYLWLQSNHFDAAGVSLTASVGIVPLGQREFRGFVAGLWHEGVLHRFATYNGVQEETIAVTDETFVWTLRNLTHRLELRATHAAGALRRAAQRSEMHKRVAETMLATVDVRLTTNDGAEEVFVGTGRNAGLEVYGDIDRLLQIKAQA